jgi:GNAT superfamily N-acetyltransferase
MRGDFVHNIFVHIVMPYSKGHKRRYSPRGGLLTRRFQQGKGYGSALLQYAFFQCDHNSRLAYLESSNPKNIPLYQRHGFELLGTIHVGTSPSIFPMLHRPQ